MMASGVLSRGCDILIDDQGQHWTPNSNDLRQHLRCWRSDIDLTAYALRNLGFVRIKTGDNAVRITFLPRRLSAATIEAIALLLVKQDAQRHIIETINPGGRLEIVGDVEDAVSHIIYLGDRSGEFRKPSFFVQPLSLQRLANPRLQGLQTQWRTWKATSGRLNDSRRNRALDGQDSGRTMLVQIEETSATFAKVGPGYTAFGDSWASSIIGKHVEDQPDPDYGRHVVESFFRTHAAAEPTLELVEAEIRAPGTLPVRMRYERLLLPWRTRGASFVSSSTALRMSLPAVADT